MRALRAPAGTATRPTDIALPGRRNLATAETGAERVHVEPDNVGESVALDRAECLRLLGQAVLGRVVHTSRALPSVHPVTYALCGQEIIFRTGLGSILRAATLRQVLAFEADDIDPVTREGWNVVVVGKAHRVNELDRLTGLAERLPPLWTTRKPEHTIALPARLLTGRRLDPTDPRP